MPIFIPARTVLRLMICLVASAMFTPAYAKIQVLGESSSRCAGFPGEGIYCWGDNYLGGAGVKPNDKPVLKGTRVLGSEHYQRFEFSEFFGCFSDQRGQYHCWGRNDTLALGRPHDKHSDYLPKPLNNLPPGVEIKQLSLGGYHGCALSTAGKVACWGNGDATLNSRDHWQAKEIPIPLAANSPVIQLAPAASGHCAVHQNGQVSCWGQSWKGQLGRAEQTIGPYTTATLQADVIPTLDQVKKIASQGFTFCALHKDKAVSCWGWNLRGKLNGNSKMYTSHKPEKVLPAGSAIDLYSALEGFCVTPEPSVEQQGPTCWGVNLPNLKRQSDGYKVAPRPELANIDLGPQNSCWVKRGIVDCWGNNHFAQLGNGGVKGSNSPLAVKGLPSTPTKMEAASGNEYSVRFIQNGRTIKADYSGRVQLNAAPFTIQIHFPYSAEGVGVYVGFDRNNSMYRDARVGKPLNELSAFPDNPFSSFAEYNDGNRDAYFVDNGEPDGHHYWGDDRDQTFRFDKPCQKQGKELICTRYIKQTLEKCETPPGGINVCRYHPIQDYRGKQVSVVFSDTWRQPAFPVRPNVQAFLLSFD